MSMIHLLAAAAQAAQPAPPRVPVVMPAAQALQMSEGDVTLEDFRFRSGETVPELRMHYTALGRPHRNGAGVVDNAVMILHGTGGDGKQFLRP